jgi:hypothetical protein
MLDNLVSYNPVMLFSEKKISFDSKNSAGFLLRRSICVAMITISSAQAFTLSNGEEVQCQVSQDGKTGIATEIWNHYQKTEDRHPELGRAVAIMRLDANGWPTIILDAQAHKRNAKGAPATWDFVFFHECAHAQDPDLDEIGANCAAYKAMARRGLMNFHRMKELEAVHYSMLMLPEEYGGSGLKFWQKTLDCARRGDD